MNTPAENLRISASLETTMVMETKTSKEHNLHRHETNKLYGSSTSIEALKPGKTSVSWKKLKKKNKVPAKIVYFNYDAEDERDVDWGNFCTTLGWRDDLEKIMY